MHGHEKDSCVFSSKKDDKLINFARSVMYAVWPAAWVVCASRAVVLSDSSVCYSAKVSCDPTGSSELIENDRLMAAAPRMLPLFHVIDLLLLIVTLDRFCHFATKMSLLTSIAIHRLQLITVLVTHLQSVLCAAARLVLGMPGRAPVSAAMHDMLHWLSFPQHVTFKLCLLTYKCLHGLAPDYLSHFCTLLSSVPGRPLFLYF